MRLRRVWTIRTTTAIYPEPRPNDGRSSASDRVSSARHALHGAAVVVSRVVAAAWEDGLGEDRPEEGHPERDHPEEDHLEGGRPEGDAIGPEGGRFSARPGPPPPCPGEPVTECPAYIGIFLRAPGGRRYNRGVLDHLPATR